MGLYATFSIETYLITALCFTEHTVTETLDLYINYPVTLGGIPVADNCNLPKNI